MLIPVELLDEFLFILEEDNLYNWTVNISDKQIEFIKYVDVLGYVDCHAENAVKKINKYVNSEDMIYKKFNKLVAKLNIVSLDSVDEIEEDYLLTNNVSNETEFRLSIKIIKEV